MNNLENFNLVNFVLHYNSILCFCNPQNIYHKNTESHESTKILTLKIFRLYGICTCMITCILVHTVTHMCMHIHTMTHTPHRRTHTTQTHTLHMHTCAHTHTTHARTDKHTHHAIHTCKHNPTYIHIRMQTHIHTHIHTHAITLMHMYVHTDLYESTHMHGYIVLIYLCIIVHAIVIYQIKSWLQKVGPKDQHLNQVCVHVITCAYVCVSMCHKSH